MEHDKDPLRLENQICFALWLASKSLTRAYQPLLAPLNLTYPQYLAMIVLWQEGRMTVTGLGERLGLDSGTLSPLLKKMESKGFLTRGRDPDDERALRVELTATGQALKQAAADVPACLAQRVGLRRQRVETLLADLKALNLALAESHSPTSP